MKSRTKNRGLLSNGKFSTLDWLTMIAAAHRARGMALREMTSALFHRLWFFLASDPLLSSQARDIVLPAGPRLTGLLPMGLAIWRHRSRTRRHLARLDARDLDDTGLTRAQQRAEAGKWFWQA